MQLLSVVVAFATLFAAPTALVHSGGLSGVDADPCPFGYGDGCGGGQIDSATKAKVANILEGILKNLGNKKSLVQGKTRMSKISHAGAAASRSASVDHALKMLLARLRKNSKQNAKQKCAVDALETLIASGSTNADPLDPETKATLAIILEGVVKNLGNKKSLVQDKTRMSKTSLAGAGVDADPCPFGYGDGCGGGQIDSATKAKVANILEGILKNLGNKKSLVQDKTRMSKTSHAGAAASRSASVDHSLKMLLARLRARAKQGKPVDSHAVDALETLIESGSAKAATLDPETKATVGLVLEGVLKSLHSKQ